MSIEINENSYEEAAEITSKFEKKIEEINEALLDANNLIDELVEISTAENLFDIDEIKETINNSIHDCCVDYFAEEAELQRQIADKETYEAMAEQNRTY